MDNPDGAPASSSRQPAVQLLVAGMAVAGLTVANVTRNNFLAADIFSAEVALQTGGARLGVPDWATGDQIAIELKLGFDGGAPQSLISGSVDTVTMDVARQTLTLAGRDYTSLFIDVKTAEKFQNLTSSQVVTLLAGRQGLSVQATATQTPTGKYYDTDHASVTNEISEWTLLTYLAQQEGFDIFVEGQTLYFQPPPDAGSVTPYAVTFGTQVGLPTANVTRLSLQRSLTLARDVVVKVISWNHELKTPITATMRAQKLAQSGGGMSAPATTYIFREQGLTQDQATAFAQAKLTELTLHERRVAFDLPGDPGITPRSIIRLSGTGTDFDQDYFVSRLHLRCGFSIGCMMRVEAKNASPHSMVKL